MVGLSLSECWNVVFAYANLHVIGNRVFSVWNDLRLIKQYAVKSE